MHRGALLLLCIACRSRGLRPWSVPQCLECAAALARHAALTHTSTSSFCPPARSCLQVRIVRIFNTYGPRMALDDGRVVSNFVSQVGGWVGGWVGAEGPLGRGWR